MGILTLLFGLLGGLCAIVGIITVTKVLPPLGAAFNWDFWSMLAVILLLASIASGLRGGGEYE